MERQMILREHRIEVSAYPKAHTVALSDGTSQVWLQDHQVQWMLKALLGSLSMTDMNSYEETERLILNLPLRMP